MAPDQAWVEIPLDKEWMVAYRLGLQSGRIAICELRLFPREPVEDRLPGQWAADALGYHAQFPFGGISSAVLRGIRIGEHRTYAISLMEKLGAQHEEFWRGIHGHPNVRFSGLFEDVAKKPKGGRPRQLGDLDVINVAWAYVLGAKYEPRRPRKFAARRLGLSDARVRDLLHVARMRGYLEGVKQGYAGGSLTDLGKEVADRLLGELGRAKGGDKRRNN